MPFAALHLPEFPLQAVLRIEPPLASKPFALTTGEGKHAALLHATEVCGLDPGLAVTLALSRCPGLQLRPRDLEAENEAQRLLLATGFCLSPRVENTRGGLVTVDLQGADPERTRAAALAQIDTALAGGLRLRIGISDTPLLAELAGYAAEPFLTVGDARAFLAPLPLSAASPTRAQAEILGKWGLVTLGDLCALSKADVAQRLGTDGAALWERASGEATRVLRTVEPPRTFAAAWTCEPPVESIEPLLFRLRRFAERLSCELRAAGLVAANLSLTLLLEDEKHLRRDFRLPEPTADVEIWIRVLHTHLETVRTEARVCGVECVATPVRPARKQGGLFDTGLRDPVSFWETLARLQALVGAGRVGTPVALDSHRPDAFELATPAEAVGPAPEAGPHPPRGLVLRRFRPPKPVRVILDEGQPVQLLGSEAFSGPVRERAGPWLTGGEWWQPSAWWHETWHVTLADGGCYQLLRDGSGWQLEGVLA